MTDYQYDTFARGKLLLTGEYFVLDGAESLALPVRYGQRLQARPLGTPHTLRWASLDQEGAQWFGAELDLGHFNVQNTSDTGIAARLTDVLAACRAQRPDFLTDAELGWEVVMQADFPRAWGLGTSSTLVAALSKWADVDPYAVLEATFGGSGYDLACAYAQGPILYRRHGAGRTPDVREVAFAPSFADQLYFVYLGQKQDSRAGIRRYRQLVAEGTNLTTEVTRLTHQALEATSLADFESVLRAHEALVSSALQIKPVQAAQFADYQYGTIKSLGAWGGDFVLTTSNASPADTAAYFAAKGCDVCIRWADMV
jgi:mevalonate kinase